MIGELTPDQQAYVTAVSAGTGLDPSVVAAWVGTESPWNADKAGGNYLNIGPGLTYPTSQAAAGAAVDLINNSPYYSGIRAAVPAGPAAQVAAIGSSPWGTNANVLTSVYDQLAASPQGAQLVGTHKPGTLPNPTDPGQVAGALFGGVFRNVTNSVVAEAGKAALGLVFVVAAFGLIALGLNRLTGTTAKQHLETVQTAAGSAATLAALA